MNSRVYRILFLVVALALTVGVFSLWGEFGRALGAYMAVAYKDEPAKPAAQQKGVVTMTIVQPKRRLYYQDPLPIAESPSKKKSSPQCKKSHTCR